MTELASPPSQPFHAIDRRPKPRRNATEATPLPSAATVATVRVLYVDDDPICTDSLVRWLRHDGFDVSHAAGPREAEALIADSIFDVVLSDICMPGNCELEWIERWLGERDLPPIVLITGSPALNTAMRAANLAIAAYLVKPCDPLQLSATLRRLATDHRRRNELRALADGITQLARSASAPEARHPFHGKLFALAASFSAEAGRTAPPAAGDAAHCRWRTAIVDAIKVLEATKHSFRSRELAALRRRLEALLAPPRAVQPVSNSDPLNLLDAS